MMEREVLEALRGKYVAFDGIGGCGKSTVAGTLLRALHQADIPAAVVREPGGTVVGEEIRKLLLALSGEVPMRPETELMLFMAARSQLSREVVPRLQAEGSTIVGDRSWASSWAYQGVEQAVGTLNVKFTYEVAVPPEGRPDVVVVLDLDHNEAVKRRGDRADRYSYDAERFAAVRRGYRGFAENYDRSWNYQLLPRKTNAVLVDGHGDRGEVYARVEGVLRRLFVR